MRSLRSRLILASVLWTAGLLACMHMLSLMLVHAVPNLRGTRAGVLLIIALCLMAAGLVSAVRSLTPFRRLRQTLAAVKTGASERVTGTYPTEVQPLVDDLNALLDSQEQAVRRAFATAGDLAHGLKTPLALLRQEAERAAASGDAELSTSIGQQVDRMSRQIDFHLARARAAATAPAGTLRCPLAPSVEALVRTMKKLHSDRSLQISSAVPDLFVRVRREDLDEIVGNVVDNACKWARTRVSVTAVAAAGAAIVFVDDDGPGLPPSLRETVLERGIRLDEAAPGSGLGLAIVRDLCDAYSAKVSLLDSPEGGLRVRLSLPSIP